KAYLRFGDHWKNRYNKIERKENGRIQKKTYWIYLSGIQSAARTDGTGKCGFAYDVSGIWQKGERAACQPDAPKRRTWKENEPLSDANVRRAAAKSRDCQGVRDTAESSFCR